MGFGAKPGKPTTFDDFSKPGDLVATAAPGKLSIRGDDHGEITSMEAMIKILSSHSIAAPQKKRSMFFRGSTPGQSFF